MTDSNGRSILILGGTSDIGRATALAFAEKGCQVQLAGRNPDGLQREAADIAARSGHPVSTHHFDVLDGAGFPGFIDQLPKLPDVVVCVIGVLGEQSQAERDADVAATIMRSNFEGPAQILHLFAAQFETRGSGTIVGISSVAGDRGRASNYVYGAAKAGFTAFLSGLRNRVSKRGVHVVTVKPGFVRTQMTAGMKLPGALTAEPREVAEAIVRACDKNSDVIYVRPIWRLIMTIIGAIPERIFKRLSL
jgi:decaprenylphospho-beta-D-erythro-pentofuranosid-2-ulose 2-reductase